MATAIPAITSSSVAASPAGSCWGVCEESFLAGAVRRVPTTRGGAQKLEAGRHSACAPGACESSPSKCIRAQWATPIRRHGRAGSAHSGRRPGRQQVCRFRFPAFT